MSSRGHQAPHYVVFSAVLFLWYLSTIYSTLNLSALSWVFKSNAWIDCVLWELYYINRLWKPQLDNLMFFWPCIMNWLYINYQLWCTDYYVFIKYYSPLHVSSLKCSSSGGYSCTRAAYGTVTLYESSWWPIGRQATKNSHREWQYHMLQCTTVSSWRWALDARNM